MNGHNECESFIIAFENDSCFVYIILLWSGSTKNVLFIARIYVGTRDTLLAPKGIDVIEIYLRVTKDT